MRNWRKIILCLLAMVLLLSGCGQSNDKASDTSTAEPAPTAAPKASFEFPNGVRWHMTVEEVRELERKDGREIADEVISFGKDGSWKALHYDNYPFAMYDDRANAAYIFDQEGLEIKVNSLLYNADDPVMTYLEGAITAMYGAPIENDVEKDSFFHSLYIYLSNGDVRAEEIFDGIKEQKQVYWESNGACIWLLDEGGQVLIYYYNKQLKLPL